MKATRIFDDAADTVYVTDREAGSSEYMKTVAAFANGSGGRLVFGAGDGTRETDGIPRDRAASAAFAVEDAIRAGCEPAVAAAVSVRNVGGRRVVTADIPSGAYMPYRVKGLGPGGIFVRAGGETREAPPYMEREMTLRAQNRAFDRERTGREISAEEADAFCGRMYSRALELCGDGSGRSAIERPDPDRLVFWRLVVEEGGRRYATVAYLLLEGSAGMLPGAYVRCDVFGGAGGDRPLKTGEFHGPLDTQAERAVAFVLENIGRRICPGDPSGCDGYGLPVRAVRELVTDALCFRSYLSPAAVRVSLYDDRLEVMSPGTLEGGLTVEAIVRGQTKIRNPGISQAFLYMGVKDGLCTDLPDVLREAAEYGLPEPEITDVGGDLRVILYRRPAAFFAREAVPPSDSKGRAVP